MKRREMLGGMAAFTGLCALAPHEAAAAGAEGKKVKKYPNEYFYTNGEFDQEKARNAYFEMFEAMGYSLGESMKTHPDFWVAEFGLGDFANAGMAGIFWVNDKEHGYFGHEIFLLPGQMIPEHSHHPAEGEAAKHEAWQVRHGSVHTMTYGGSPDTCDVKLPQSQFDDKGLTCFKAKKLELGGFDVLNKLEEPHFMIAGPDGAVVTEYASFHSGDGLRFTNPKGHL